MENHHFQWVNPLFLWPCSIATLNYQRVTACSSIFPCDPLRPCHRAVVPRYGALGVMNDFRGVTSAYGYGDSYLVTWRFRAWTLATKQKFMDFLYGFYMVLPCLHVILALPVLCYCFWYIIYKFVCLNLFDVVCSAIPGPWLQLDTEPVATARSSMRAYWPDMTLQYGLLYSNPKREKHMIYHYFSVILLFYVCVSCYS